MNYFLCDIIHYLAIIYLIVYNNVQYRCDNSSKLLHKKLKEYKTLYIYYMGSCNYIVHFCSFEEIEDLLLRI